MEVEFIVIEAGTPVVKDTGVSVREVVDLWRSGVDLVDLPTHFPQLSVWSAASALRYYGEHMAETE